MTTLGVLYQNMRIKLRDAGVATPDLDARLLLSHALGCAPEDVLLKPDTPVSDRHTGVNDALMRRLKAEPVAKIIGRRAFYGLDFEVNKDVLDPRADTETLVDAARSHIEKTGKAGGRILDLCTGSGCILITLLSMFSDATGVGSDVSGAALTVADRNLRRHGIENRAQLLQSHWLENVSGRYDVVVCNPPYIASRDIENLDADVRLHDPRLALDGGEDGLVAYKIIFPQIRKFLFEDGIAVFEIGFNQADDVTRLAVDCGLRVINVYDDLNGQKRVVALA